MLYSLIFIQPGIFTFPHMPWLNDKWQNADSAVPKRTVQLVSITHTELDYHLNRSAKEHGRNVCQNVD